MEETSYFLNLVVKSDKPVVLTGSMRPSTSLSADGPLNIYNAVGVASDARAKGRGVLVVANDDIHGARAITKRHTTDVETFVSPEVGLIGVCLFDDREFGRTPVRAHTTATPFKVAAGQTLPRVDIIYAHAGMSPDLDRRRGRQRREGACHRRRRRRQHDDACARRRQAGDRQGRRGRAVDPCRRGDRPPQHRGGRRQGRHRRVEGAQPVEGPRAAEAGADADVRTETGSGRCSTCSERTEHGARPRALARRDAASPPGARRLLCAGGRVRGRGRGR